MSASAEIPTPLAARRGGDSAPQRSRQEAARPHKQTPAREAYRIWAPQYAAENAVTALEDAAVRRMTPALRGRSLLDAGCGTGRRLPGAAAGLRRCVGIDLVPEMLNAGRDAGEAARHLVAGDLLHLPLRDGLFDTLWCRLVLGHIQTLADAYHELARVARAGASLIVTDFHPAAAAAGHTRSFRAANGQVVTVEHQVHTDGMHTAAAERAGWVLREQRDLLVGPEVRPFYERANALERYRVQRGLPLVLQLSFQR